MRPKGFRGQGGWYQRRDQNYGPRASADMTSLLWKLKSSFSTATQYIAAELSWVLLCQVGGPSWGGKGLPPKLYTLNPRSSFPGAAAERAHEIAVGTRSSSNSQNHVAAVGFRFGLVIFLRVVSWDLNIGL